MSEAFGRNLVHCPKCGRTLFGLVAGAHVKRTHDYEVIGRFLSVKCRCGGEWESEEARSLRQLAAASPTPQAEELRALLDGTAAPGA